MIRDLAQRLAGDGGWTAARRMAAARHIASGLRDYPEQAEIARVIRAGTEPLLCVQANRRGGKTQGIGDTLAALAVVRDGFVIGILAHTLVQPTVNYLDRVGGGGLLAKLAEIDLLSECRVQRQAGAIKAIRLPWGSEIRVYDIGDMAATDKARGPRAHRWWCDEAQSAPHLARALTEVVLPTLLDYAGQVILSGTPGREVDSFFRAVSEGLEDGWAQRRLYSWTNVGFGADKPERWCKVLDRVVRPGRRRYGLTSADVDVLATLTATDLDAVAAREERQLPEPVQVIAKRCDPAFLRELWGWWVRSGSEYVYDWHTLHQEGWYWCRQPGPCDWGGEEPVLATIAERVAALPKVETRAGWRDQEWRAVVGLDIGWHDASAIVVWVYSRTHPHAYELWSEAHTEMPDTAFFDRLADICEQVVAARVKLQIARGDLTGDRKGTQQDWDRRLAERLKRPGVPTVRAPRKHGADEQRYALNLDLLAGLLRIVRGSALDVEGRYLRYRDRDPDSQTTAQIWKHREITLPDGSSARPGDHCLDAARYALQDLGHLRGRTPDVEPEPRQATAIPPHERRRQALERTRPRQRGGSITL